MDHQSQGWRARKAGDDFETEIEPSFTCYQQLELAWLDFYPVPMTPAGKRDKNGVPLYRPASTAPFDVWGWHVHTGKIIAAELKSSKSQPSLPIVLPKLDKNMKLKPGNAGGIHYHQLEMLRNIAVRGGVARLVWSNEGQIGVLSNDAIINAWQGASTAWQVERAGKSKPAAGLKSIKWEKFNAVDYQTINGCGPFLPWLRHHVIQ